MSAFELTTPRLRLLAADAPTTRLEMEDRSGFAAALAAAVPDAWPPEMLVDALPWFLAMLEGAPEARGFYGWYAIASEPAGPTLVGSGGFKGPPREGLVEVGYSVLPDFFRRGFGGEMVGALVAWALRQPGVTTVVADILPSNTPSIRLVERLGFCVVGPGEEPGHTRWRRGRSG